MFMKRFIFRRVYRLKNEFSGDSFDFLNLHRKFAFFCDEDSVRV